MNINDCTNEVNNTSNCKNNLHNFILNKISDSSLGNNVGISPSESKTNNDNINFITLDHRNIILAKCEGLLGIHYCENKNNILLSNDDQIIINNNGELEFASVIEKGIFVNYKRQKEELNGEEMPFIERVANDNDIDTHLKNIIDAKSSKKVFLDFINELSLEMKLVDVHYQFDKKKIFFFYTADGRIDFRQLAKNLAAHFKTRIELRQIGVRDEAKRLGGIATCGREYCCATFISNFKRITTDIASENNISSNISKHTGPCGKLKCCLSFEI